jgi:hypothetical protein
VEVIAAASGTFEKGNPGVGIDFFVADTSVATRFLFRSRWTPGTTGKGARITDA